MLPTVIATPVAPPSARRTALKLNPRRSRVTECVNIAHVTAEYGRYAHVGGLAEAVAGLAEMQARLGHSVTVFLPLYRALKGTLRHLHRLDGPATVRVGSRDEPVQYLREGATGAGPRVVLIDSPLFSERDGVYGENGGAYADNHRRFAVFARAAAEGVAGLLPTSAIVHAHDWHAGLVPMHVRADDDLAARIPRAAVVFSVHNAGYQGRFPVEAAAELGFDPSQQAAAFAHGELNMMKAALRHSDRVVTVSPTHAGELRTPMGGFGLDDEFRALGNRLHGIPNGIDEQLWDPSGNPHIAANYSIDDLSGKATCKAALQRAYGLPVRPEVPVFVTVSRLVEQKGFDLVLRSEAVRSADAQFVFLGRGEPRYHAALSALASELPGRVAVEFGFTDTREHQLLAGADALLMPSLYEPCGLSQLHAQRYGTVVIARRVGGLHDTVDDERTGFVFDSFSADAFDSALRRAIERYDYSAAWQQMMRRAMARRSGWDRAANAYAAVYAATRLRRFSLEPVV